MPTDSRQTAVDERLDRLRAAYRAAFPPERAGGCCLWVLEARERPFLESVVAVEAAGHAQATLEDIFVMLNAGGAGGGAFAKTLGAEVAASLREQEAALVARGVDSAAWEHAPETRTLSEVLAYVDFALAQIPDLRGRKVVFLNPADVADAGAFARLLSESLAAGLPEGYVLMVASEPGGPLERALGKRADLGVTTLRPELDMHGLSREMVTQRDEEVDDAPARFRQLFVDVSEYGAREDFARMRQAGDAALAMCRERAEWGYLTAAVLLARGGHLLASKPHRGEATADYERAVAAARASASAGHPSGHALLVQSLLGQGAAYFHQARYDEAAPVYAEAAERGSASADTRAIELEARRMYAVCLQHDGHSRAAFEAYERTLAVAETLDAELCRGTSLPYVGTEMMGLARELGRRAELPRIRERMEALLGDAWDAHLDRDAVKAPRS